jgi:hypothetical protein
LLTIYLDLKQLVKDNEEGRNLLHILACSVPNNLKYGDNTKTSSKKTDDDYCSENDENDEMDTD